MTSALNLGPIVVKLIDLSFEVESRRDLSLLKAVQGVEKFSCLMAYFQNLFVLETLEVLHHQHRSGVLVHFVLMLVQEGPVKCRHWAGVWS